MAIIYLAGPIDGIGLFPQWRAKFATSVLYGANGESPPIAFYDPSAAWMIRNAGPDTPDAEKVCTVNRAAIELSTLMVANLLLPERPPASLWGFGTIREIEYAISQSIPVLVVGPVVSLMAHDCLLVPTLEEAARVIRELVQEAVCQMQQENVVKDYLKSISNRL